MDLRTIINTDAAGVSNKNPTAQQQQQQQQQSPSSLRPPSAPSEQPLDIHRVSHFSDAAASPSPYPVPPESRARPPQPPPLQPPLQSPSGSSSYGSAQSPYQHNSASSLSAGPHSQSGGQPFYHTIPSRESHGPNSAASGHAQSAGLISSPYTPRGASSGAPQPYFSQQHPQPPAQSVGTPSAHSFPYHTREGSVGLQQQPPPPPPPQQPLQQSHPMSVHPPSYSPNHTRSQPGTPLGPPPASFSGPSPHLPRPPSSGRGSQHNPPSSPWHGPDMHGREFRDSGSPIAYGSYHPSGQPPGVHRPRHHSIETDKEPISSVSPRTSSRQGESVASYQDQNIPTGKDIESGAPKTTDINNRGHFPGNTHDTAGSTALSQYPPTTPTASQRQISNEPTTLSPPTRRSTGNDIDASGIMHNATPPTATPNIQPPLTASASSIDVHKRKRRRYNEPPIFARRAPRVSGRPPPIPSGHHPSAAPRKPAKIDSPSAKSTPKVTPLPRPIMPTNSVPDGKVPVNGNSGHTSSPSEPIPTSLGPWEPSIMGVIPHEEVTKIICDFLFQQVVMRKDIGAGPAGGSAVGQGAILEVEAKLGQFVDRNRGSRLHLPVLTECIISKDDPNMRIAFESSMSLV